MIPTASSNAYVITVGPDGNLWFTEANVNQIGLITTDGTVTEFALPTQASQPAGITAGPDGNL
jgi:virginiamycin B lyase